MAAFIFKHIVLVTLFISAVAGCGAEHCNSDDGEAIAAAALLQSRSNIKSLVALKTDDAMHGRNVSIVAEASLQNRSKEPNPVAVVKAAQSDIIVNNTDNLTKAQDIISDSKQEQDEDMSRAKLQHKLPSLTNGTHLEKQAARQGAANGAQILATATNSSMNALEQQIDSILSYATHMGKNLSALERVFSLRGLGQQLNLTRSLQRSLSTAIQEGLMAAGHKDLAEHVESKMQSSTTELDELVKDCELALSRAQAEQLDKLDSNLVEGMRHVRAFRSTYASEFAELMDGVRETLSSNLPEIDREKVSQPLLVLKERAQVLVDKLFTAVDTASTDIFRSTGGSQDGAKSPAQVVRALVMAIGCIGGFLCFVDWF